MSGAWTTLLAAFVSGSLVLAGVAGTLWHQRRLAEDARAADQLNAQRKLLAAVIAAAWEKERAYRAAELARHAEAWKQYDDISDEFERLLTEALLFIGEPQVVAALERVRAASPVYRVRPASRDDPEWVATQGFEQDEHREAVSVLQQVAAARFRRTGRELRLRKSRSRPR